MALNQNYDRRPARAIALAAIVISIVSLGGSIYSMTNRGGAEVAMNRPASVMQRIESTGVLRVGYGGFPPYTIVDPKEGDQNRRVKGFVVDMVNEIAARHSPPLKVEWYNLNWETFRADMLSGKFDFLADAVYETVPKAAGFAMTDPFSYFGIAAAVVRKHEDRFNSFRDLDRADITISLAQGYVSTDYAQQELKRPTFKLVPIGKDAFAQLDEVLFERADVALNDIPTVVQYVRAHPDKVKALWVEAPPSWVAAGFVVRQEDVDLLQFLNTSIRILKVDGTLNRLDRNWKSLGFFEKLDLVPGSGLTSE